MRFLPILSFAFLTLTGCSAASIEDASSSQSSDLVAPYWTAAEEASSIVVSARGSGDVSSGSQCAPGTRSYVINTLPPHDIYATECAGTPARTRARYLTITDTEYTAVISAARSVARSDKKTCDEGAAYVSIGVYPRETGVFPPQFALSDHFGCGYTEPVTGIERVLAVIDPIATATPASPPSVALDTPSGSGARVWHEGATFYFQQAGAGDTPPGSTCIRGAADTFVTVVEGQFQYLGVSRCVPLDDDSSRLVMNMDVQRVLEPAEREQLTAAMSRLSVSYSARCQPSAQYERLTVSGADGQVAGYTSADNACVMGVDYAPYVDFAPLREVLQQLAPL